VPGNYSNYLVSPGFAKRKCGLSGNRADETEQQLDDVKSLKCPNSLAALGMITTGEIETLKHNWRNAGGAAS